MVDEYLPDDFYTEDELIARAHKLVIHPVKATGGSRQIVAYRVLHNDVDTGKVLILAVESILDTQDAVNRLWSHTELSVVIGYCSYDEQYWLERLNALYVVLDRWRYEANSVTAIGLDRVYTDNEVIEQLINK